MITGIVSAHRSVLHLARYLEELGATVLDVDYGRKHIALRFRTKEGITSVVRISQGRTDPMKLRNFARQSVNHAAARVEHVRSLNTDRR